MSTSALAQLKDLNMRSQQATARGAQAYERLLMLAETSDTGQARRVALFVAATFNGRRFPFDLFELRAVDQALGDDMLACLDALRWGCTDLYRLVPDGEARVMSVIDTWGLRVRSDG